MGDCPLECRGKLRVLTLPVVFETDSRERSKSSVDVTTSGVIEKTSQPTQVDFREVFEQQSDYVFRTLRFLGIKNSDLEDVAHDVFLHVFRHLTDYDPARPLRPWLYAFIYRTARDFRKLMRHRETSTDDFARLETVSLQPDAFVMRQQMQRLALCALEVLDADERGVFVATLLDELTAPQVADALQIPLNTVYSRLRRARTKFDAEALRLSAKARHP